jgi:archaellum component FlaG (FlaF/FlaG flagellin family)
VPGVEIDFTSAGETAKAVTDSTGHFAATLAAGTWTVHLVTNLHIVSGPQEVTVVSGSTATATYVLDSGTPVPVPQQ